MIMEKLRNKGFTLIELIIVIGILGVLAVAAVVALNPIAQFQKANDVRKKSDLAQIQRALESYYQDNNSYPVVIASPYQIPGVAWGKSWEPYMTLLPQDPDSSKQYVYYSDGQTYYIYASLDRGSNDAQACNNDLCSAPTGSSIDMKTACGGGPCDFGVSSPDVTP
jgi:prepilin-type N-terminal cleavage/methylation domain-containing protein